MRFSLEDINPLPSLELDFTSGARELVVGFYKTEFRESVLQRLPDDTKPDIMSA
jgi:hypothetical protein